MWKNKIILITGGTGFVATKLVEHLCGRNCRRIIRIGRPGASFVPFHSGTNLFDVECNLSMQASWVDLLDGVDVIFHLAAQTSVYVAEADPLADAEINVLPTLRILEACRQIQSQPIVILAGTATIAGLTPNLPVSEAHPDKPITIYDLHKQMSEHYLEYYANAGHVQGTTLRLANVYGPGPRSSRPDRGILNLMISRALRGETLTIYGDGNQVRDYLYIDDVVLAFVRAAENVQSLNGQHFVLGSGQGNTLAKAIHMVAERVQLQTGRLVPVVHTHPPGMLSAIEERDFVADSSRFCQLANWRSSVFLEEGIDRTAAAMRAQV